VLRNKKKEQGNAAVGLKWKTFHSLWLWEWFVVAAVVCLSVRKAASIAAKCDKIEYFTVELLRFLF